MYLMNARFAAFIEAATTRRSPLSRASRFLRRFSFFARALSVVALARSPSVSMPSCINDLRKYRNSGELNGGCEDREG